MEKTEAEQPTPQSRFRIAYAGVNGIEESLVFPGDQLEIVDSERFLQFYIDGERACAMNTERFIYAYKIS